MSKRAIFLLSLFFLRCILGLANTLNFSVDREVSVKGKVVEIYYNNSDCIMSLGNILLNTEKICAAKLGEEIVAVGKLERRLIESFEGKMWLVSKQIERLDKTQEPKNSTTQDKDWLDNFRESLVYRYKKAMPEPEAGLLAGVVFGYKNDIGQDFYKQMIKSGAVHIAVASGYNILLVGGAVMSICFWFWRRQTATWVAFLAILFYASMAGGEPPVIRAVWMAGMMYLGQVLGRKSAGWWTLVFTAWAMLMVRPSLIGSVSFQLSLAASFGLVVIEPYFSLWISNLMGERFLKYFSFTSVTTTLSTMIVTLPIIWWHFGKMTLIGILSNILILPVVPLLMIFGVGMLLAPWFFLVPTYVLTHWVVMVIKFFGT